MAIASSSNSHSRSAFSNSLSCIASPVLEELKLYNHEFNPYKDLSRASLRPFAASEFCHYLDYH